MKRYNIDYDHTDQCLDVREKMDGQWVRYEDVAHYIEALEFYSNPLMYEIPEDQKSIKNHEGIEIATLEPAIKTYGHTIAERALSSNKKKPSFRDYVISKHGSYPPQPGVPFMVEAQALFDCFAEWVEM